MAQRRSVGQAALLGFCGLFVGLGIGRFGYPALIPALIGAGWMSAQSAHLAAAFNLAGYLVGALGCPALVRRIGLRRTILVALWLTVASFLFAAVPLPVMVFQALRFLSGVTGAVLMTAVAPLVTTMVDPSRRGRAGGMAFAGAGSGFIVSGALVPLLAAHDLGFAWIAIAAVLALASLVAGRLLPHDVPLATASQPRAAAPLSRPVIGLTIAYGACAVGYVPATVIFVDYVGRVLGLGLSVAGLVWMATGLGAVTSPLVAGFLAERIGFAATLRLVVLVMGLGTTIPVWSRAPWLLAVSGATAGGLIIALAAVASGRARDVSTADTHPGLWSKLTVLFAALQAAGAYAMSGVLAATGNYAVVFAAAAAIILIGLAIEMALAATDRAA